MRFASGITLICFVAAICLYTSCQKAYSIDLPVAAIAKGGLLDSSGNCLPNSVSGTFYDGITPGRDTAYVTVMVNVAATGSYAIISNTVNGVYFADSGCFSATGINNVRLKPVGTPLAIGTSTYAFSFDSTACYFSVQVKDSTGTGLGHGTGTPVGPTGNVGTWQLSAKAGDTTRGYNAAGTLVSAGGVNALSIAGTNQAGDTTFNLALSLPSAAIPSTGQFTAASGKAVLQVSTAAGSIIYSAIGVAGVTLTVSITSYNSSSKELKGTFGGVVKGPGGSNVTLSAGSFDVLAQ